MADENKILDLAEKVNRYYECSIILRNQADSFREKLESGEDKSLLGYNNLIQVSLMVYDGCKDVAEKILALSDDELFQSGILKNEITPLNTLGKTMLNIKYIFTIYIEDLTPKYRQHEPRD